MRARTLLPAGAALALALAGCGSTQHAAAPAPRIPITLADATAPTAPIKVGIIYTPTVGSEGSDEAGPAEGAVVAAYRLAQGGTKVSLDAVSDHGTAAGARQAEQQLVSDGVVGILDLSNGPHIAAGLQFANADHVPVLVPYDDGSDVPAGLDDVWLTGPTMSQQVDVINAAAASAGTLAVVSAKRLPSGLSSLLPDARRYVVGPDSKIPAAVGNADAVVVWGDALSTAGLVERLEQSDVKGQVLLSESAATPTFADTLQQASQQGDATTDVVLTSAGEAASDFQSTTAMEGFLHGLRAAAVDPSVKALDGVSTFGSTGAASADTRSYDALVALVNAAARGGDSAAGVLKSLPSLKLGAADGLAGPALDFADHDALASSGVAMLESTTQQTGLRPSTPAISWFILPKKA